MIRLRRVGFDRLGSIRVSSLTLGHSPNREQSSSLINIARPTSLTHVSGIKSHDLDWFDPSHTEFIQTEHWHRELARAVSRRTIRVQSRHTLRNTSVTSFTLTLPLDLTQLRPCMV